MEEGGETNGSVILGSIVRGHSRRFVLPSIRRISDLENSLRSTDKSRWSRILATRDASERESSSGGPIDCLFTRQTERGKRVPLSNSPFSNGVLLTPRASSIRQTKRSHSHLNLYSHVQHTRDYECVGLMKPGKASAFAPPTAATPHPPPSHIYPYTYIYIYIYSSPPPRVHRGLALLHSSRGLFLFILRRLRHFPSPFHVSSRAPRPLSPLPAVPLPFSGE